MLKVKVTGKPMNIRNVTYQNNELVCLDFEQTGSPNPPKSLPKAGNVSVTVVMNQKQWKTVLTAIEEQGDTIQTANKLFVEGEVSLDLPSEIIEGDLGVICFQTEYIAKKEREATKQEKSTTADEKLKANGQKTKSGEQSGKPVDNKNEVTEEMMELHKKYNGVCQKCGQHMDKKLVDVVELNGIKGIQCPDCRDEYKPQIHVNEEVIKIYMKMTKTSRSKAISELTKFPQKYAMVAYNNKNRHYWCWDKECIVETMIVKHDGEISKILFRKGAALNKGKNISSKKSLIINGNKYNILSKREVVVSKIEVPELFQQHQPRKEKIQEKVNYFLEHKKFDRLIVVTKTHNGFEMLDGYARYLAASDELNLNRVEVLEVLPC